MEKRKAGAEFYVERGNSRANEIIVGGLGKFGLSDEYEQKDYGGEKILVWKVSLGFIKELYKDKAQWPKLEFRLGTFPAGLQKESCGDEKDRERREECQKRWLSSEMMKKRSAAMENTSRSKVLWTMKY
jgi:hypothetical protein